MEINLKEKLRTLRQQRNITQEALANHLGITPQSVGKWERGEGFPDITLLPKIAFYFNVNVTIIVATIVKLCHVMIIFANGKRTVAVILYKNLPDNMSNIATTQS